MGQDIEQIAFLGANDLLHFGELILAEAFLGKTCQQLAARVWRAPDGAQLVFVTEKFRQPAE